MDGRHSNLDQMAPPARPARAALCVFAWVIGLASPLIGQQAQAPSFEELAGQAAAAREQQNLPLAVELYGRAEQLKPDWTEGWWYLTLLQYSSNQFAGAIDAANHLLALEPHAVPAMALRGLSEFEIADYKSSLSDLEMAVQHGAANDPHNEQIVRYHLALDLARAGRFQDALDQYKVFAEKGVAAPEMLVALGLAGMRITSFPAEIADGDRPLYQAAGSAGYAFLAGDSQKADALFEQLFNAYPSAPKAHLFYGLLLFSHDPALAAEQFRSEIAIAPGDDSAHALLAYALMIAGRYQEALPEAEKAYSDVPGMEMAQIALGRSLGETGDIDGGTRMLEKVLAGDPNNLEAHMGLAALFARAGKREDAYRERMVCLKLAH